LCVAHPHPRWIERVDVDKVLRRTITVLYRDVSSSDTVSEA
jgi:hypothetical protein